MAVYRRCTKCSRNLNKGVRVCPDHGKAALVCGGAIDIGTRGKRKRKSIGYHATKADAVARESEMIRERSNGLAVEDHDLSLGAWHS